MEAGLNLYSLRRSIATEEDLLNTTLRLKEMGYSYLQYSGGPFEPERIKRISEQTGIPFVLTHVPLDRILDDTDALMEEHAVFGCKNIGLGGMPPVKIVDEKECKDIIEKLNVVGEKMANNGFSFFYHNHQLEFFKHGSETIFEFIVKNAPFINFTLDTYWVQYGGADILALLDKLKGRIECVHLKDYMIQPKYYDDGKIKLEPVFAPVGDGTMNFSAIVEKMKKCGTKYFLVEQDNAPDFDDPFAQVERSIKYIKEVL